MKLKLLFVFILAAALLCGAAAAEDVRVFTDDLGRTIVLPAQIDSAAPSGVLAQVSLYTIDPAILSSVASSPTIGDKTFLDQRISTLSVTGSFYGAKSTMNPEEIMELNRQCHFDVIIDIGSIKKGIEDDLNAMQEKTGLPFAFISQDRLADVGPSYRRMGELLGMQQRGDALAAYFEKILSDFDAGMKKAGDKKVSMIYVTQVNGNSVYMVGSGKTSYHAEVINAVADNLAPEAVSSKGLGDTYSMEDILLLDPDYIIVGWEENHKYLNEVLTGPSWQSMRAVCEGHVFESPGEPYPWMGNPLSVNRFLSIIWLGNLFYPDVFSYDLKEKVCEFYGTVYHRVLTDEEYAALTQNAVVREMPVSAKSCAPMSGVVLGVIGAVFAVRRFR